MFDIFNARTNEMKHFQQQKNVNRFYLINAKDPEHTESNIDYCKWIKENTFLIESFDCQWSQYLEFN